MKWISLPLIILFILILGFRLFLPKPPLLESITFSQAVYDDEGHLLRLTLTEDEKYRLFVPLANISPTLIQATLLQEDQFFYQHPGFNPIAILKAFWGTYILKKRQIGASTITMQLARIRYNIHSKSLFGKFLQIYKAIELELFYSKKEILEAYLNAISYGGNIEGIGAASIIYFSKPAENLNLREALMLCVIPQNPRRRNPYASNHIDLQNARFQLFHRWVALHPEDQDKKNLINLPFQLPLHNLPFHAPHFVNMVLENNQKPIVQTTLNLKLQKKIEKISRQYLEEKNCFGVHQAAVLLTDIRNMEVKALLGSANFFDQKNHGQVNGAKAKRSPGSTLKPFIYALALDQGLIHPCTVLKDAPCSFRGYNPENFDKDFLGPIKAKDALILSRNIPAICLLEQLKNPTLYEFLLKAEIGKLKPANEYGLSLALGGAELSMTELASLYAMLANYGVWQPLRIYKDQPVKQGKRLLSSEASFLTLDMLAQTPRPLSFKAFNDEQIAVYWKTGTSSGYRDAWCIGIFGPYILTVWIGDFECRGNPAFVGLNTAAPLFFKIIGSICKESKNLSDLVRIKPEMNLVKVQVCEISGQLPNSCCTNTISTWFIPGVSPILADSIHREIAIDNDTGLRACRFDQNTRFAVYEFWPSDLLKIFAQAGIQRKTPPSYATEKFFECSDEGIQPQIISPQQNFIYPLRSNKPSSELLFYAIADSDVKTLFWFLDSQFIGSSSRDESLSWLMEPGSYTVRVMDDHGRTCTRNLVVQVVN